MALDKITISPDLAIIDSKDDALGRTRYAESCASAIAEWRLMSSLVIGIFGDWGSGKTSLKNLIVQALEKHHKDREIRVVEFNPWQVVSQDCLTKAFFDELAEAAGTDSTTGDATANTIKQYSDYLSFAGKLLDLAKWIPGAPAGVIDMAKGGLDKGAEMGKTAAEALNRKAKPLSVLKKEAEKALRELAHPILVVLDDLDRLTQPELLLLLQLVKANADFPNIMYLLLAQRSSVVNALETIAPGKGDEFLEKIIQVPLNLPQVDQTRVHRVLDQGLERLLKDPSVAKHYDEAHASRLFRAGLGHFFVTLRDVNRYLSTLSFHIGIFKTGDAFEVNLTDLFALEVLRVFCEPVYRDLPALKEFLTDVPRFDLFTEEKLLIKVGKERLNDLIEAAPAGDRKAVRATLALLFPPASSLLSDETSALWGDGRYEKPTSDDSDEWVRGLHICSHQYFDTYFQLSIPEAGISNSTVAALLAAFGNRELFSQEIARLTKTEELPKALSRLYSHRGHLPKVGALAGSLCLADIPVTGETFRVLRTINHCHLLNYIDQDQRREALLSAVTKGRSLFAAVTIAGALREGGGPENVLVDADSVAAIRRAAAGRISSETTWLKHEEPSVASPLLMAWRSWGDAESCRQTVANLIATPAGFLRFLQIVKDGLILGESLFDRQTVRYFRFSTIEMFTDIESIEAALVRSQAEPIPSESAPLFAALNRALDRRKSGEPDFNGTEFDLNDPAAR